MQINLQVVLLKLKTCQAEEELGKTIIRTFENRKVHSSFIGNIWDTDLAVMQLISKCNKEILFYMVLILIINYAWVFLLKDKTGMSITTVFQKGFLFKEF